MLKRKTTARARCYLHRIDRPTCSKAGPACSNRSFAIVRTRLFTPCFFRHREQKPVERLHAPKPMVSASCDSISTNSLSTATLLSRRIGAMQSHQHVPFRKKIRLCHNAFFIHLPERPGCYISVMVKNTANYNIKINNTWKYK